jgi:hypothetical protein
MKRFHNERDAKEYLVGEIVGEADREGQPLSEIERKMLHFTETGWTLPDIAEVNEAFDRQYDRGQYERKISRLARASRKHAGVGSAASWSEAVSRLATGDHYLSVMVDRGGGRKPGAISWRDGIVLLAIASVAMIIPHLLVRYVPHRPRQDDVAFFQWITLAALAGAYFVLRLAVGRRRFDAWMDRAIGWVARGRRS